jgi:hypothetical protein
MTNEAIDLQGEMLDPFLPFRLDTETEKAPSRFELRVARAGSIFIYRLAVNQAQIFEERLDYIPSFSGQLRSRLLFRRVWLPDENKYSWRNGEDFGSTYKSIQPSLRDTEPFISFLARRLKSEVTEPLTSWLKSRWPGITLGWEQYDHRITTKFLGDYWPEKRKFVAGMIRSFDTGISDIEIEKTVPDTKSGGADYKVWVHHTIDGRTIRWGLEEESTGTQRLFSLAYKMLESFDSGDLVIVDELGSNIHPNIARTIISQFQSSKINKNRAQLIFTSHDNTLQRSKLLRRDQIWFTQKKSDGSTDLYPLTDFHPRNDLAIDKAYLDGRFGAVPIIPADDELFAVLSGHKHNGEEPPI